MGSGPLRGSHSESPLFRASGFEMRFLSVQEPDSETRGSPRIARSM